MTRLQAIESNAYDVLGVPSDASAKAIDDAFHRLIEGGGYRIGVPLRRQWLRAHQIKEAYATLGDPIKRRAYDESLKGPSERALWPAAPDNDPGLAALLRLPDEEQPPAEPTPKSAKEAPGPGDVEPEQAAAGVIGSGNDEIDPHIEPPAASPGDGEPVPAPDAPIESANDDIVPEEDQPATWAWEDSPDEVRHGSAKLWGGAAVAALALGSLVYFGWPSGESQMPGTEIAAQLPPGAQQVNSGAPTTGQLAKLPPAVGTDETFGEVRPWGPGHTSPVPDSSGQSVETAGATETAAPGAAAPEVAAASETQAQADAEAVSGAKVASAMPPAPAPVSSGQTSPEAELAAAAPPPPAPIAPPAQASSAAPPSVAARQGTSVIHSPAQLIGGGPTHADNPRGRHVGSVIVQFTVQADGRVSNCGAVRSSGKANLDAFTCRLVEQRMRFRPARDAQGNPVASTAHARYEWGRRRRSLLSSIFR